ncbi:hypothetical protein DL89DRAFT_275801 [Linderina pennispora]|uniref:Major facilitator superfamily (MFS) profile domain-containing protein n=1 Tax=Linderina pennispora TaxID=61395 RepID=A0A1Y1W017_9FUNG|nr:uncharacterized protein DL89DRAFT_275801 [Linderina pennispora]ORX66843.1 hypothetical protein DL89DRAFT_275801 [Linderina pennispora]
MPLKSRVLTLLALALSIFIAALDQTIVASSMPAIAEHFGALSSVNWIATSFLLASTALQPLYGRLSDIFGRIETLVVGLVIFLIGSAVSGAAATLPMLIAGRAVQGLGASALMSLVMVIVADITIERERGKLSSVFGSVWAISSVLGPVLGGVFTDSKAGWRWVFYFSLPVGAVAGICSFMDKLKRVDFIGIAVLVIGVVMFLLALSFGGKEYPWSSPTVICLLVFGILVILAFAVLEWKVPSEPIMPMRLFQNRNVGLMLVLNIFLGAVVFGPTFYIPIYFSVVKNASAIGSGLRLLPFMLPITFCSIFCGIFTSKTGRYRELIWVGGAITTLGIGLLALLNEHSSAGASIGILLVSGIGVGFCLQPTMIALQTAAEPRDMATATTLFVSVRTLGGTISLAIFQAVLQNAIKPKLLVLSQQFPEYAAHIASTVDRQSNIYSPGIPEDLRNDIVVAYVDALRLVFYAMIPFAAMILVCTLPARHVPLKTQMTKTISE